MIIRLTETVFVQEAQTHAIQGCDWNLFDHRPAAAPIQLSHVVNFYNGNTQTKRIQELTAESMRRAAASTRHVRLLAVRSAREKVDLPRGFKPTSKLQRTVADVGQFSVLRSLPLLFDILRSGAEAAKTNSYLIFTNSDICVQPNFYSVVRRLLQGGFDCLIINRRTVSPLEVYGNRPELAALEIGSKHPGTDCFVFPASWLRSFVVSHACVGVGFVMRSLLFNLVVKARRMLILRDAHLTYHYGDDRIWNTSEFDEYTDHNVREARTVLTGLSTEPRRRQLLADFCVGNGEHYPNGSPVEV